MICKTKPSLPLNRWLFFAIIWFFLGAYALLRPGGHGAPPFPHFDKVAHFFLFFSQFWLVAKVFWVAKRPIPYFILATLAIILALGSEVAQAIFAVNRMASLADAVADLLGAATALWLAGKVASAKTTISDHSHHQ